MQSLKLSLAMAEKLLLQQNSVTEHSISRTDGFFSMYNIVFILISTYLLHSLFSDAFNS
jgi:hypothetical protein